MDYDVDFDSADDLSDYEQEEPEELDPHCSGDAQRFQTKSLTLDDVEDEMEWIIKTTTQKQVLPKDMGSDLIKMALEINFWNPEEVVTSLFTFPEGVEAYCSHNCIPYRLEPMPQIIDHPDPNFYGIRFVRPPPEVDKIICGICYVDSDEFYRHWCGGAFCLGCWKEHIKNQVMEHNRSRVQCPNCPIFLEDRTLEELSGDSAITLRLREASTQRFIQSSKYHQRCSAPDCCRIFRISAVNYPGWKRGLCACGFESCLDCSQQWHGPLDCATRTRWAGIINNTDGATQMWLLLNSKPCPECKTPIEKIGGCNHMRCSNKSCRYQFCWFCMEAAHDHSFGETCSRYRGRETPGVPEPIKQAIVSQERYQYYCERYENMIAGAKPDSFQDDRIQKKKESLLNEEGNGIGVQDLKYFDDIPTVLRRSRLSLANSYAILYLTEDSVERDMFETNLEFLQAKLERLSWYLKFKLLNEKSPELIEKILAGDMQFCMDRVQIIDDISESNYKTGVWKFAQNLGLFI